MEERQFGPWLAQARQAKGFKSTNSLAEAADVNQSTLSKIERGKLGASDEVLAKLAPVLGLPIEDLKREALRDRLDDQELEAAAEIVAERKSLDEWTQLYHRVNRPDPPAETAPPAVAPARPAPIPSKRQTALAAVAAVTRTKPGKLLVFGEVACGFGADTDEEPVGELQVADTKGADHAVLIRGDSMLGLGFTPGSHLLVKKAPPDWRRGVPSGREVIARYRDDGSYTCKTLTKERHGDSIVGILQGAGDGFEEPIDEFNRPFDVVGIVVGHVEGQ